MINVKKFWEEHKKEIIVGTIVGVSAATAAVILTRKYHVNNFRLIPKSHRCIAWKPVGNFITLEDAKAALDLNANNMSQFAILKDGNDYAGIILNNSDVILPQI